MRTLLSLSLLLATTLSIAQVTPCIDGFAGIYPCDKIDLMSHMTPGQLGSPAGLNDIWGWTDPLDGHEYALVGKRDGTAFVDVTDPQNPVLVGFLPSTTAGENTWRDIKVYADHAFIVSEASGHGMQIYDLNGLRDIAFPPVTIIESAHYNGFSNCHNLAINEETGYAYPIGTNLFSGGPHFINIQDPQNPVLEGSFSDEGYSHDGQVVSYIGPDPDYQGAEIYVGFHGSSPEGFILVDVTVKNDPQFISRTGYDCQDYSHQGWLTPDHRYGILSDELDEGAFGYNTRTRIFNIEDLDNPVMIGNFISSVTSTDHNLYTMGDHAFMSNYTAGLRVVDISGLDDMLASEVAYFDVHPSDNNAGYSGSWSNYPYFASGSIVVTHRTDGLFIVKMQDLLGATAVDPIDTNICPAEVSVAELEKFLFSMTPNPVQDQLLISSLDGKQITQIEILDLTGRKVMNLFLNGAASQQVIDLQSLELGAYLLRVNGITSNTKTFIKN